MTMLFAGSLFLAFDVNRGSWTSQTIEAVGEPPIVSVHGIRYDWIPDEVGHLLFIAAFFALWRVSRGATRKWHLALIALQLLGLAGALLDHFIIGQRPLRSHSSDWKGLVSLITAVAMGWVIASSCRSLGLDRGARLWRRFAVWIAATFGLILAVVALIGVLSIHVESEGWLVPVLGVLYLGFLFILWAMACFGTRSEALSHDPDAFDHASPVSDLGNPGDGVAHAAADA